ncbi:phasin family protein [Rhodovulum sp. YNF3179]|uniref:phasin family protein n=1 Tax=Rhodovulum sp. YNF3179 TaxID=3425127 RepID=UPI003D34CA98
MTKTQDFTKTFTDMMDAFPGDMTAMNDMFRNTAQFSEKMSKIALTAAEQSAEISNKWTKDTLSKMSEVTKAQEEPADYSKVATDIASSSVETASENMAAFAEIAKRVQMETIELMLAAGKDATEEVTATAQKTTRAATKKAS